MSRVQNARRFIATGFVISGLVAMICVIDLILAVPFGRSVVMDILLIISALLVGYLAYDARLDLR